MAKAELIDALRDCATLLKQVGESFWSEKLEQAAAGGDQFSAEAILSWFGGMGSFTDLVISPLNGHAVGPSDGARMNVRLRELRSTIFEEARHLDGDID